MFGAYVAQSTVLLHWVHTPQSTKQSANHTFALQIHSVDHALQTAKTDTWMQKLRIHSVEALQQTSCRSATTKQTKELAI
jgi:predicted nucleic acid-binding Zn ribbon protein